MTDSYSTMNLIRNTIRVDTCDDVLTVVEYLVKRCSILDEQTSFTELFNNVFEKEYVGYRFINNQVAPITEETEFEALGEAINSPYKNVNQHLDKSLKYFSDRTNPDYANSIKESISAVEAMCSIILGKSHTLGAALKNLEDNGFPIHPALKEGFLKIYDYTSDAPGIRHAGNLGGRGATFEEAKFMLVSCSAFINYLKSAQAKVQR